MREVTFPTSSPFTLRDAGDAVPEPVVDGRGLLAEPPESAGGGRPAVVILQGLGGILPEREPRYAAMLAGAGHVALAVDSFRAREVARRPFMVRALTVTSPMMLADAFGALAWLRRHPRVDAARVAVMGFSYGAMVSAFAAYEQVRERFSAAAPGAGAPRFAAHVGYYGCTVARFRRVETTGAPVLLLLGGRDRNVSIPRAEAIARDLRAGGSEVTFRVYPEAYHQWDGPDLERRHTRFSLRRCRFVVEPDGRIRDRHTGFVLDGMLSRGVALAASMDLGGYHMLRDEGVLARSDADLLSFLEGALGRGTVAAGSADGGATVAA